MTDTQDTTHTLNPFAERYDFDCGLCSYANGWAQLDTRQDAPYYGNWINPNTFEMLSFCEGDVTHKRFFDSESFADAVRECIRWHDERGYGPAKIDALSHEAMRIRFTALGLAEYLH